MPKSPAFFIGDLPIHNRVVLAPLSGYNDPPFRRICRAFGAGLIYTGLLCSHAIVEGTRRSQEMMRFYDDERPLVCQLYGKEPEIVAEAARKVANLHPEVIDLNLGCAKPKITRNGYGSALLQDPHAVTRLVRSLVAAVDLPITAKIRLGWETTARNHVEIARILEECGVELIAVHGRAADQLYDVPADWDAIAEVKQAVRVPVLANGDVRYVADVERILRHTGCDGVMVGRAAVGNPWFFSGRDLEDVPWEERLPVILEHLRAEVEAHGEEYGVPRFRKHLVRYIGVSGLGRAFRREVLSCRDLDALVALLTEARGV